MKKQHNKINRKQLTEEIIASVFYSFLRHNKAHNPEHNRTRGCMSKGHPFMKEKWLIQSNAWTETLLLRLSNAIHFFPSLQ